MHYGNYNVLVATEQIISIFCPRDVYVEINMIYYNSK